MLPTDRKADGFVEEEDEMQTLLDRQAERESKDPDEYSTMPAGIKGVLNRTEYLWLSDYEKGNLIANMCEPDA